MRNYIYFTAFIAVKKEKSTHLKQNFLLKLKKNCCKIFRLVLQLGVNFAVMTVEYIIVKGEIGNVIATIRSVAYG